MGTVLVLTGRDDLTADAVIDELTRRNASVVRYDTSDFPQSSRVAATLGAQGWEGHLTGERSVDLTAVSAVWWRRPAEFSVPSAWPDEARAFALSEARVGVLGVLGSLPVRWINHPAKDSAANYKPVQLAVAARAGLDVPRTIITSDPDHAREFIGADEVIYKGLSGGVLTAERRHRYLPTTVLRADEIGASVAGTAHLFKSECPSNAKYASP
ncbi:MvdC/MvdD family ATP grasp protein [Kribbella sp. WER1]